MPAQGMDTFQPLIGFVPLLVIFRLIVRPVFQSVTVVSFSVTTGCAGAAGGPGVAEGLGLALVPGTGGAYIAHEAPVTRQETGVRTAPAVVLPMKPKEAADRAAIEAFQASPEKTVPPATALARASHIEVMAGASGTVTCHGLMAESVLFWTVTAA